MNNNDVRSMWVGAQPPIEVVHSDHPFSCGNRVLLYTACRQFKPAFRVRKTTMREHLPGPLIHYEGMASGFDRNMTYVVSINDCGPHLSKGFNRRRVIELLTHELSHVTDYFFRGANIKPCTEVRAYTNDWMMGKFYETLV